VFCAPLTEEEPLSRPPERDGSPFALPTAVTIIFPRLLEYNDIALLLLRCMVAAVFITSGWSQVKDPVGKGKQNEISPGLSRFVGTAEILGGLGVLTGVLAQLAALGLIVIMLGSIKKKIVDWHTGFWGKDSQGWSYDSMFVLMNLVIATTGGGRYVLPSLF
jgi:putative oxidoreductase